VEIPASYKGREQAFVKHTLLKSYLERLFMIVGQHEKVITYVDCFAGPWQESSTDLRDTSIAISLDIIGKCHEGLQKINRNVRFRALYVEKDQSAFNKLEAYLNDRAKDGIETKPLRGEFIDLRNDILSWCGTKDFTFFFIDPKGWKQAVEISTLLPLLQRPYSEYLINFMYDFLLRIHTQDVHTEDIKAIFGEVPNTHGMSPKEREAFLLKKYRDHLKSVQPASNNKPRSAYVAVLDPVKDRTKYHLVYLTRHALGIKVFMEASEKLDIVQKTVRSRTKQDRRFEKTGQFDIFAGREELSEDDDRIDLEEVKKYWLTLLSPTPKQFDIMTLAEMLEETGWFIGDFQDAFRELESESLVKNLTATRKRPVNVVNFEKGEKLMRILS
jgi:three-Cys-motif partner protein